MLFFKSCLKGQFTPKSKIHIFPLTFGAIYQSRLFWCELPSFGDTGRRDFCLLSNAGVFKVFQAKDPQTDGEMERAPLHILYKIVFYIKLVL